MKKNIIVLGSMDSKGKEYNFIKGIIESQGFNTFIIDVGVVNQPLFEPDITRHEVIKAAGEDLDELIEEGPSRDKIAPIMAEGAKKIVLDLFNDKKVSGIISCGGTQGTTLSTNVMRALPIGFPKVMVSTMASGDTFKFVGLRDITMMNSVADILGLNRVTNDILSNAAGAICGMARIDKKEIKTTKQLIGMTNVGITTPGAMKAKEALEKAGYEVIVFHAVGTGGQAMEQLIKEGVIEGVLDLVTIEVMQELFGGLLAATPERMTVAANLGIPQVICPGAVADNTFGPPETIPESFQGRPFARHNPLFTNVRVNAKEMKILAKEQAKRVNPGKGPMEWFIPMGGFSYYSSKGQPLYDPESDKAYLEAIKKELREDIPVHVRDVDINNPSFGTEVAEHLIELMKKKYG